METKVALGLIHGGPPQVIIFLDDSWPLIMHCCSLFVRYDLNQFGSIPMIPKFLIILVIRMSWLTESNAFLISRKMTPLSVPLSIFSSHWSYIWIRAVTVEWFGRNPEFFSRTILGGKKKFCSSWLLSLKKRKTFHFSGFPRLTVALLPVMTQNG